MTASALELAGMLAGCGAAAFAIVARQPPLRSVGLGVSLTVAPILVVASVWDEPRVTAFREDGGAVALAIVASVVVVGLLAVLFARFPFVFPVVAFAVLPLRIPIEIGGEEANLLLPLYAAIAAAAVVSIVATARGGRAAADAGGGGFAGDRRNPISWLRWLLAATLVAYAAQSAYSRDVANAIEVAGFFLIPFAAMFVLLLEARWTRRLLGAALAAVAAVAAVFAAIAVYQYLARDLFLNEELLESNQIHQYFRVNSLFFDPNILGRYLALAVTALAAYVAWTDDRRGLAAAAAAAALVLCGLAFSFSITSFAALLAGLGAVAILRWRLSGAAVAAGMGAVAAAVLLLAGGAPASDLAGDRTIDSGRGELISGGLELAGDRPVAGWGSGSFGVAFSEQIRRARTTVSHSEPVTVAAEQGLIGLAIYLPLLAVSLLVLLGAGPGSSVGRSAAAACLVVMLVHSLGYAGFAIDPATWALLAVGITLREAGAPGG